MSLHRQTVPSQPSVLGLIATKNVIDHIIEMRS